MLIKRRPFKRLEGDTFYSIEPLLVLFVRGDNEVQNENEEIEEEEEIYKNTTGVKKPPLQKFSPNNYIYKKNILHVFLIRT